MGFRERIIDYSKGDSLRRFWRLYHRREKLKKGLRYDILTFLVNRCAQRRGGYVGPGAKLNGEPVFPHGLHGVFISRYAEIGTNCRIYQNVTIGEIDGQAPVIGNGCLIGAGAVVVGGIRIGCQVKIGAGAVVCTDIPDHCTVVCQPGRIIINPKINFSETDENDNEKEEKEQKP